MNKQTCDENGHVLRTERFLFGTPTEWELVAAHASGSDRNAQRWLGWSKEALMSEEYGLGAIRIRPGTGPRRPATVAQWTDLIAIDVAADKCVGSVGLSAHDDGSVHLGGHLAPDYRYLQRGYRRELFGAGLELAHQHFGVQRVRAGAEPTNGASRRSLIGAGFVHADGPPSHTLPDGGVIPTLWFDHNDPHPARCGGPQPTWTAG